MASGEALFNPYLPEFHTDPYPFYHRLRAVAPVYQTPMGFWVLTRYDDVVTVLRDPRFGRDGFEQMLAAVYGDDTAESSRPLSVLSPSARRRSGVSDPDGVLGVDTVRRRRHGPPRSALRARRVRADARRRLRRRHGRVQSPSPVDALSGPA